MAWKVRIFEEVGQEVFATEEGADQEVDEQYRVYGNYCKVEECLDDELPDWEKDFKKAMRYLIEKKPQKEDFDD